MVISTKEQGDVFLHQELSKRDGVSALWLSIIILMAAVILIGFNTILVRLNLNSGLTDLLIIGLSVGWTYIFIKRNLTSYKYCLIEDEFIIHQMIGSKEKGVLNLNIHQVKVFDKVPSETYSKHKLGTYGFKKRLYNCENKSNRHFMVYEEGTVKNFVVLQPSDHMIKLIHEKLNRKV